MCSSDLLLRAGRMVCESGCQVRLLDDDTNLAQIEDIPGHDKVALTRKFGNEKWVHCSAA